MKLKSTLKHFLDNEKAGGIVLMFCVVVSLTIANTYPPYNGLWTASVGSMDVLHWINDGLMAIFFLLVGLELKREFIAGELSKLKKALMPVIAAVGGVIVPAGLYLLINIGSGKTSGVGIPMATDIVFALGVLSLLGNRVPVSVKVFLTALAVIDDMCAILVIAVFYSQGLSFAYLAGAAGVMAVLMVMNRLRIQSLIVYLLGGVVMWYCMHHSGVHATLTGVLLALVIPIGEDYEASPSNRLQMLLHKPVAFIILPLFALGNTSILLSPETFSSLLTPVSLGIIIGLVVGKPLGIVLSSFVAVKLNIASLPLALRWKHLAGIGLLGGIGFTISMFMCVLAFDDVELIARSKVSVLIASFMAGVVGYLYLSSILKDD